jgi:hypothetical protein
MLNEKEKVRSNRDQKNAEEKKIVHDIYVGL